MNDANMTPDEYEKRYVKDVYDVIAKHFASTRAYLWGKVFQFRETIKKKPGLVLEVGSGNGKNLVDLIGSSVSACDISDEFVKMTLAMGIPSLVASNLDLPYRSNLFDYVMSIAVIHHLSTRERRLRAISELVRVLAPGGIMLIQVWAFEQEEDSKRKFEETDCLIEWNLQYRFKKTGEEEDVYHRYYHLSKKGELEALIGEIQGAVIVESFYERGNWGCFVRKE